MQIKSQHLRILFFKFFREYSNVRLTSMKYTSVQLFKYNDSVINHPSDILHLSDESLDQLESEEIGDIKLFGEDTSILNNAKYIWLDNQTLMNDVFFTQDEFRFFHKIFNDFLNDVNFNNKNPDQENLKFESLSVIDYLKSFE